MPYITREDGERFIIPSYRDTLSAKKPVLLKKEILLLSSNYGNYITLQRKNVEQFEASFSPEPGYLLGETVWHYFKRPLDLIYCEEIPNTTEAVLVIVKSGTVYLDGSFPVDSIADELVIFRTQQNNFDIYIYGDVPISQEPEEGKIALDASSVKSFNVLAESAFAKLPRIKAFQLQLVDVVLKSQGIGVFPTRKLIAGVVVLVLFWLFLNYLTSHKREVIPTTFISYVSPYQLYITTLTSPDPADEIAAMTKEIALLYSIPGWSPAEIDYGSGMLTANMVSAGIKLDVLYSWAVRNGGRIQITPQGVSLVLNLPTLAVRNPNSISYLQQVIAELTDRLGTVVPGNNMTFTAPVQTGRFSQMSIKINFASLTIPMVNLLGEQFRGLPLVLENVVLKSDNGIFNGTIELNALGN